MFKVGQKVICIDDAPMRNNCAGALPLRLKRGEVYTIRSIHTEPKIPGYGVRLEELLNPSIVWADGDEKEWSYQSERFQPVAEAKPFSELGIAALCGGQNARRLLRR